MLRQQHINIEFRLCLHKVLICMQTYKCSWLAVIMIACLIHIQQGITCIGFRDVQEKDKFLHQIDRVVKLEQERSIKLRGRKDSEAAAKQKPNQLVIH